MALPSDHSKAFYNRAFKSDIFEPVEQQRESRFRPKGQRRDQTTSELFGDYADKDLRASPKTFSPKDDGMSARDKKQAFLSSAVLPRGHQVEYTPAAAMPRSPVGKGGYGSMPYAADPYADDEDEVDPKMRRQAEQSSDLFGRETPGVTQQQVHSAEARLMPSDFKWFDNHSKNSGNGKGPSDQYTHSQRGYKEKCSNLFNHSSPEHSHHHLESFRQAEQQAKQEEHMSDAKRRQNVYYSDIFNRGLNPEDAVGYSDTPYRPKHQGHHEDKITVHQDWTDSKTEFVFGARQAHTGSASERKSNELHKARIFHREDDEQSPRYSAAEALEPVSHDNSHKVKQAIGRHTQEIHQAHLRSSTTNPEFYEEAYSTCHWEVVELHVSGLHHSTDEGQVRALCASTDLHIVKVTVDMDPVRNLCKGRAKVVVRYNPKRDSLDGLLRKFEEQSLRVEV